MSYLLIRFSSLGDVVLVSAAAASIKKASPEAEIDILTKPEYAPVLRNNPDIRDVITSFSRKKRYDYLIDIHNSLRSTLVKYCIPASKRLKYNKLSFSRRVFLFTGKRDSRLNEHVIDRYLSPVKKSLPDAAFSPPGIYLKKEELKEAGELVKVKDYLAISPCAKWKTKQWLPEKYTGLLVQIIKQLKKDVVLLGMKKNRESIEKIRQGTGLLKKHVVNLAGQTDVRQLCAVIKNSSLLVSPDTAAMHIGWAVSTPVVAMFGPTVKEFGFQPVSDKVRIIEKELQCRPCSLHGSSSCRHKDRACMKRIEVGDVMKEIKSFL